MKLLLAILFFCTVFTSKAQNLVPNPSFEDTIACPDGLNQINRASGWSSYGNTPDYWNTCSQSMNVPNTSSGFQNAFKGNAFCGVYTCYSGFTGIPNYREYIGSPLIFPLIIGQKYFVSFKLNKPNNLECATNNFGALFSTVPYSETNPTSYSKSPQIISAQIITDTLNWVTISSSFFSDSAYKYVILGSFNSDSNTNTILYNGQTDCIAYYFIDMICVSTDSLTCNSFDAINEISLCDNDIKLFPNPANDKISITTSELCNNLDVVIYNMLGKKVNEYVLFSMNNEIDIRDLHAGVYFFQISFENKSLRKKITIIKNK